MSGGRRVIISITLQASILQRLRDTAKANEMSVSRVVENLVRRAFDEADRNHKKGGDKIGKGKKKGG